MNLQTFISELNSHQKTEENPRIVNANGSDCMIAEYNPSENLIVIYFEDNVVDNEMSHNEDEADPIPVEGDELELPTL